MLVIQSFVNEVKKNVPFPLDTFGVELEKELKMIWFYAKNCYLWVTKDDKVEYRSTLLNKNAPEAVMKVFNDYITPKIVKELDVIFTESELITELKKVLADNPVLSAEQYKVNEPEDYKVKTSIHFQISQAYGSGDHSLIPNLAMVGVGKSVGTKSRKPLRYCSLKEFKENGLGVDDIDVSKLLKWLKPFVRGGSK